jgi:hypothetical protein
VEDVVLPLEDDELIPLLPLEELAPASLFSSCNGGGGFFGGSFSLSPSPVLLPASIVGAPRRSAGVTSTFAPSAHPRNAARPRTEADPIVTTKRRGSIIMIARIRYRAMLGTLRLSSCKSRQAGPRHHSAQCVLRHVQLSFVRVRVPICCMMQM